MPNLKISQLPTGQINPQTLIPVVTNGVTSKININELINSVIQVINTDGSSVNITWEGLWSENTTYSVNSVVQYDNSSYICVSPITNTNNNENPSPSMDTVNWALLASQGIQGVQGVEGIQGIQGIQGVAEEVTVKTLGFVSGEWSEAPFKRPLIFDINTVITGQFGSQFKLPSESVVGREIIVQNPNNIPAEIFPFNNGVTITSTQVSGQSDRYSIGFNERIRFIYLGNDNWLSEFINTVAPIVVTPFVPETEGSRDAGTFEQAETSAKIIRNFTRVNLENDISTYVGLSALNVAVGSVFTILNKSQTRVLNVRLLDDATVLMSNGSYSNPIYEIQPNTACKFTMSETTSGSEKLYLTEIIYPLGINPEIIVAPVKTLGLVRGFSNVDPFRRPLIFDINTVLAGQFGSEFKLPDLTLETDIGREIIVQNNEVAPAEIFPFNGGVTITSTQVNGQSDRYTIDFNQRIRFIYLGNDTWLSEFINTVAPVVPAVIPNKTTGEVQFLTFSAQPLLLPFDINTVNSNDDGNQFRLPLLPNSDIGREIIVQNREIGQVFIYTTNDTPTITSAFIGGNSNQYIIKFNERIRFIYLGSTNWLAEIITTVVPVAPVTKVQKTTITAAQVLQLFTTPIAILNSGVEGKWIYPTNIYIKRNVGDSYILATNTFNIINDFGDSIGVNINPNPLTSSAVGYTQHSINIAQNVIGGASNTLYRLSANTGNPTLGTGTLDVYVTYNEITL